ncbi:MAG TPA: M23 family metallopeptidase [Pyrinomonadaceae bacterium]|nr:M23 family metallopeptidase [Pyrinomonadaceae bacterium]
MGLNKAGRAGLAALIIVMIVASAAIVLWSRGRRANADLSNQALNHEQPAPEVLTNSPATSPLAIPTLPNTPTPEGTTTPTPAESPGPPQESAATGPDPLAGSFVGILKLIIPVAGVKPQQLLDTFSDARSEGRVHDAIDIPAPAGTPVIAAADGEIIKLFQSERGGTTIYQLSADRRLVYYYAHLQGYADGLLPGKFVKQGEVIGYVGDTGNAGVGNFHLHFSISVVPDPNRYWEGTNINPYPLLRQ